MISKNHSSYYILALVSGALLTSVLSLGSRNEARASHNDINGCSDGGRLSPFNGVFKSACDAHDRCYGEIGKPRSKCDKDFRDDMRNICASLISGECLVVAEAYYAAVRTHPAHIAYRRAQRHARAEAKQRDKKCFSLASNQIKTALSNRKKSHIECTLNNYHGYYWGSHNRQTAACPPGEFAAGFRTKIEASQGGNDDTALNKIQIVCTKPGIPISTVVENRREIPSVLVRTPEIGMNWGRYSLWTFCPRNSLIVGYRTKSEVHQGDGWLGLNVSMGGGQDDTGANDFQARCRSLDGRNEYDIQTNITGQWGQWDPWMTAPKGWFVTKVIANVEPSQGGGDDTAMNMIWLKLRKIQSAKLPIKAKPPRQYPSSKDINKIPYKPN